MKPEAPLADQLFALLKRVDAYHDLALRQPLMTYPLRLSSFAAYRGLELALGERHPHERTIEQARKLQQAWSAQPVKPSHTPSRSRIMFFSPNGWYAHSTFEAVLAKALQIRGAQCEFIACDGAMQQCDFKPASDPTVTRPLCWRCQGFPRRLRDAFELPYRGFNRFLPEDGRAKARQQVAELDMEGLLQLAYRGLPIGRLCLPSLFKSLLVADLQATENGEETFRGLCESAIVVADVARAMIQEEPDAIVVCNGLFHAERVVYELARRAGIPVLSYELGWISGSYFLVHGGSADKSRSSVAADIPVDEAWTVAAPRALTPPQATRIAEHLGERRHGRGGIEVYWQRMEGDRAALAERLGLRAGQRVAAAFSNIVWDTAVFERDKGFEGMFDWVASTIRQFSWLPDWRLVVRTHPAETKLIMQETRDRVIDRIAREFPQLASNVTIIAPDDPLNSYVLTDIADVVLVYTSSIGLEAACGGRPVVVAGDVHYARRGFTHDVDTRSDYMPTIERAILRKELPTEQVELAHRYAHMLFFEFMKDFPFVATAKRADRGLRLNDLRELSPGANRHLDEMCAGILEGAPFVS